MKKIIIRIINIVCVSILIISIFGCSPQKKLYVGYVCNFASYEWDLLVSKGASKRADELGINIEIGDAALDVEKQKKFALTLLEKGVDVLVLSPIDENPLQEVFEEAKKRNVPVITDTIMLEGAQVCVGIDNEKAGMQAGEWFAKNIENNNFLLLEYTEVEACKQRMDGFIKGYNSVAPINIVKRIDTPPSYDNVFEKTIKTDVQSVNAVFGINDESVYGALDAIKEKEIKDISAVGFGFMGQKSQDMLINTQELKAELATFPQYVGMKIIDIAVGLKNNESYPKYVYTPTAVITKADYDKFYTPNHELLIENIENQAQ